MYNLMQYNSIILTQQVVYGSILNMNKLILRLQSQIINSLKSFTYQTKLLGNTVADGSNFILKTNQVLNH